MYLALTILAVFLLLIFSELWQKKHKTHSEFSRKFIHITVGSFVAFWPFFLSWNQIKFLSLAFLVTVGISRYLNIFQTIHSVQRPTWGELFFAIAVGGVAFITHDKWIYMTALLQMSLADGLAAVVGTHFIKRHTYTMFGHIKSLAGTLTFFTVSFLVLCAYQYFSGVSLSIEAILALTWGATLIENLGVLGIDNLLVPLLIAAVLRTY